MHRQVSETDIVEKAQTSSKLFENLCSNAVLLLRQRFVNLVGDDGLHPVVQFADRKITRFGDVDSADAYVQRFPAQLRTATLCAFVRGLVLTQEYADVLLVTLFLARYQERNHALENFLLAL